MFCSIDELTYNYDHPETIKQLNLSSTSHFKIHHIDHLQHFIKLKSLILSNNMITKISGLDNLSNLRVLNLEFNQIRILEGTENLGNLEELYVSYNEIQQVSEGLKYNRKLRVLHLAYNDIRGLDNIAVLYQTKSNDNNEQQHKKNGKQFVTGYNFPDLTTLSLYGNPIVSIINYLSFFKMLIPTLRCIDDRDVYDDLVSSNVCPQQQVIILREALNKLLDERNAAVDQLQSYVNAPTAKISNPSKNLSKTSSIQKNIQQQSENSNKNKLQLLQLLEQSKQKYSQQLKIQKQRIAQLTRIYSENIKKNRSINQQILDYDELQQQNMEDSPQRQYPSPSKQTRLFNKKVFVQLKQEQEKLQRSQQKIRNINKIINLIQDKDKGKDIFKIILETILFGFSFDHNLTIKDLFKLCKKYLIKKSSYTKEEDSVSGLIEYSEVLKSVIYGQAKNGMRLKIELGSIVELKNKIKNKGLLEIIAELKQLNQEEKNKNGNFERERKMFIDKFEKQTEELAKAWDQLKEQRQKFESMKDQSKMDQEQETRKKQIEMRRKFRIAEEEQRQKIIELKRARDKMQSQLEKARLKLMQTQEKLNRKFIQLEEFENHFNQFIQEKEHIKSLEQEIDEITTNLRAEEQRFEDLQNRVKELSLQEGIILNRVHKIEQSIKVKNKQLTDLEGKRNETIKSLQKTKTDLDRQTQKLQQILRATSIKQEELKDYDKMGERAKKNYSLLEQKIRNIEYMESNKKNIIKELEQEMKCLKDDKQALISQLENMDKNLQGKRQQLMRSQMKIQQNKLAIQNLADINKSISDMMIRQMELKRSIIELQIENKNLLEMKNNLLDDVRLRQYI